MILYFNEKKPKYTILFYSSTYKIDFDGGVLHFADGIKIIPKRQTGIMFDSREAHMVNPVLHGNRHVCVVKVY